MNQNQNSKAAKWLWLYPQNRAIHKMHYIVYLLLSMVTLQADACEASEQMYTGTFQRVTSAAHIREALSTADENSLVVSDIDGVMAVPHNTLSNLEQDRNLQKEFKAAAQTLGIAKVPFIPPYDKADFQLVEVDIRNIHMTLQEHGITTVACTGLPIGSGKYDFLTEHFDLGSQFKASGNEVRELFAYSNNTRYDGYLFAPGPSKVSTLMKFIGAKNKDRQQQGRQATNRIFFIDDYEKNVRDILEAFGTEFEVTGLHYTRVADELKIKDIIKDYNTYIAPTSSPELTSSQELIEQGGRAILVSSN